MSVADSYLRRDGPPPSASRDGGAPRRKARKQVPQQTIDDFWASFTTLYPGKVTAILPKDYYAASKAAKQSKGSVVGQAALKSYDEAKAECEAAVQQIARECKRVNMRYRDKHFDIEFDLKRRTRRCLDGLFAPPPDEGSGPRPRAVKRISQIFRKPQFYIDDATAADVRQGKTGDCYLLAAVGALGNKSGLIKRVCVARDEKVGVYGFVFHRDGEWIHTVVDDKLYLSIADYDESAEEKSNWTEIMNRQNAEAEYKEAFQTGSRALYFAQCNDENETWLPLLEKAFAKAHGDYDSIIGGFTGEAIEDLTGGVTTELFSTDILDVDEFWEKELSRVNKEFLFGCATGLFDGWQSGFSTADRSGIVAFHAYTIMRAAVYKGERLLLVRNPWGETEWKGRWSDGSAEWNPESLDTLNHKFGDDGVFWISFEDLLRKYQFFDRTRLFDDSWTVSQQWTTVDVPWSADYNDTKFTITLTKASTVVIVLSQLDSRYWTGLDGQYEFSLHFRLEKDDDETFSVRSHGNYWMSRSVSTELELEPGTYSVLMKISATKDSTKPTVDEVVREVAKRDREKLLQYGLAYDLAHAKGTIIETEEEKRHAAELKAKQLEDSKREAKDFTRNEKYKEWLQNKKTIERERRRRARKEDHSRKKRLQKTAEAQVAPVSSELPRSPAEATPNDDAVKPLDATTSTGTSEGSRVGDDAVVVEKEQNASEGTQTEDTQTEDKKPVEPILANPGPIVPALQINDGRPEQSSTVPTPPGSPGFPLPLPQNPESDTETVISWATSIDSDLDLVIDKHDSDISEDEADPLNEEFANDPWNAVCVVGLRVYSKEGDISVNIVRPKVGGGEGAPLDVDDPSKGWSDEPTSPVSPDKAERLVETLETVIEGIENQKL